MAYNFSLRDDEDDLELTAPMLEDAPSFSLADPPANEVELPPQAPVQQQAWSPSVQTNPALSQEWEAAERDALQRAQYNPREYGGWEALRDNGGLLIAGILDAAVNKGRGLPSLAAETNRINQQAETQRREDAKQAQNFALGARQNRSTVLNDQLRIKQLQNEDRRLAQQDSRIELANRGEGRREGQFSRQYDPNNAQLMATKQRLADAGVKPELLDGLDQKGLDDLKHRLNIDIDVATTGQRAKSEAVISGAKSDASNASDANWAPTIGLQKGKGAALGEEITRPGVVKTAAETRGATETAVNAVNAPKEEAKLTREFAEKNSGKLKMLDSLNAVLKDVPEGGTAPGTGYGERMKSAIGLGSMNSEAAQEAEAALADIIIKASADDFGANSTAKQELANAKRILGDPLASPEQRTRMLRKFRDAVQKDVDGISAANPRAAATVVNARGGQPGSGNNFGGGVKMRSPGGNVGVVPPEKVAAARKAGWTEE